ncbi:MAG: FimV/HubP family polar landmark protein [Xanthomonadales bacterium]|jgi:pilus assembly protein FimV|nr:FimV/HubP family polar landmark protein [Xanthomonadales bacterium]
MNSKTRISARALLAVAALSASPAAWSLGLGDATVESYLNQPLKARIDLLTQESDDLASVSAKLASAADYELIGASLEDISVPVRFSVEDVGGDVHLVASSQLPMNNPVIRLIVEVNWSSGRMLREYTLFLDPPVVSDQPAPIPRIDERKRPAPVASAPAAAPSPAPGEAASDVAKGEEEPVSRPTAADVSTPEFGEYGPVASGETLWAIAKDWSAGTGMSINKVMIAIQRENPQAFMNNNINLLKRGAILRMPAISEVERISSSAAYSEVVAQEQAFYQRKGLSTASRPSTPLLSEDRAAPEDDYTYPNPQQAEAESEALAAEAEPEAESLAASVPGDREEAADPVQQAGQQEAEAAIAAEELLVQDQLELVPPSESSELDSTYGFEESEEDDGTAIASQALRENLARTEEDLITQQQQNEYLEERIRELESQLAETRDANVADSDLANMEQRLKQERLASQPNEVEEPWYGRLGVWMLGLLVLAAAFAGWLFSRRSKGDTGEETIQEIKDEAEELLKVLEDPAAPVKEKTAAGEAVQEPGAEAAEPAEDSDATTVMPTPKFGSADDEADFLDEESSDPEIQLDLARAYISMGDKEAARVILEEVAANGSEEQQAEAQKMLDLM